MATNIASALVAKLKEMLGDGRHGSDKEDNKRFWIEYDYCGDTENGFYSEYEINWPEVQEEMDKWIASLSQK